jgi:hypothetical protein
MGKDELFAVMFKEPQLHSKWDLPSDELFVFESLMETNINYMWRSMWFLVFMSVCCAVSVGLGQSSGWVFVVPALYWFFVLCICVSYSVKVRKKFNVRWEWL